MEQVNYAEADRFGVTGFIKRLFRAQDRMDGYESSFRISDSGREVHHLSGLSNIGRKRKEKPEYKGKRREG